MAIRTIDYTVSLSGISPATQQFGGVQGEHNATELKFILNSDLLASIKAQAGENEVVYRFDIYDGTGGLTSTDSAPLTDSPPSYLLENKVSRMGGNVQVFLIITEIKYGETQMDLYSFPAVLRLKEKQEGEVNEAENYESISTLAEVAKESASIAENSAAIAKESQLKTQEAMMALENGAEIVFLGGNHASKMDILAAVDDEMSEVSTNPVQNRVLNQNLSELGDGIDTQFTAVEERLTNMESFIPQYGTYTPKFLYLAGIEGETWKEAGCSMDYSYGWYYKIGRLVWFSVQMKGMVTSADGMRYSGFSLPFKCDGCASFLCGECFNLHDQEIYSAIAENNSAASFQDTRGSHAAPWLLNQTGWIKVSGCYLTDE